MRFVCINIPVTPMPLPVPSACASGRSLTICPESHLTKVLFGFVLFFFMTITYGEPAIDGVIGEITHGSTISVTGTDFSSPNRAVSLKANARNFKLSTGAEWTEHDSKSALWNNEGSSWATPLEAFDAGGRFVDAYKGSGKAFNGWLKPLFDKALTSIYVSWLFKPSEDPAHSGGSNKFIRIWDDSAGKHTRISWTQMHMTYGGPTTAWGRWPGLAGQWNHMEFWVDDHTGVIEAHTNGLLVHRVNDFQKASHTDGLNIALLGFDPSIAEPYARMSFMIDELYISSTRARVLLSDQATWPQARTSSRVLLTTKWTDTEISAVVDLNPLDYRDFRYLYVVDESGSANAKGMEVCPSCPVAPETAVE